MAPKAKPSSSPDVASGHDLKGERAALLARIEADQKRLAEVEHLLRFKEYPKMVKDRTFASREEQDAAGPEYADQWMPATATLSSTTLAQTLDAKSAQLKLTSTSGVLPGMCLWFDGELVEVVSLGLDPWVNVLRGVGGSRAQAHASGVTVYIGRPDQFYASDPVGRPPEAVPVSPYINVRNGKVWFAQGDVLPIGEGDRWWQQQTTVYSKGALGARVKTLDPTSST